MAYEDMANGWKPDSEILGAGRRAYAEDVETEWDEFTGGQHSVLGIELMDNIRVFKMSGDNSPLEVFMETDFPNTAMSSMVAAPFTLIPGPLGKVAAFAAGLGANKLMEEDVNPTLKSAGPYETMEVVADWTDQGILVTYSATKYNEGGMDITTTIMGKEGGPLVSSTTEVYPYNTFKED